MSRAVRSLARGLRAVALVVLAACGGKPPAPTAPPPLPELLRLWRPPPGLQAAVFSPPKSAVDTRTLWRTNFDGHDDARWYALVDGPADQGLGYRPVTLKSGPVQLERAVGHAAVTSLPVLGGQAITLVVVARTVGGQPDDAAVPVAVVLERREPFDPQLRLTAKDVADLVDPRHHARHALEMAPSSASRTLRADFVTDRSTTTLELDLVAPAGSSPRAVVVESVELQSQPLDAALAQGGEFAGLQRIKDPTLPVVRVTFDRDDREGLLAVPGQRVAYTLPACATAQRLELSLGVAPRDERLAGAVRFSVSLQPAGAASQSLLAVRRTAPADATDAAWQDESAELPPLPQGGTLSFTCEGEGEDPPLAVFGHPTLSRPRASPPPNVVLISIDTLRADRLGCYGGDPALAPHLDALAAQGLRFAHAYSTSSYTLPSHGSLLTGQWPALHGAVDIADRLDPARSPFLARLLAEAGWMTAAFTGGGYVSPEYGFAEGFDRYASNDPVWALDSERGQAKLQSMSWELVPQQTALLRRYATPAIEDWIAHRAGGPPFFLFLHTYIVHNYAPDLAALAKHGLLGPGGEQQPFNHQEYEAFNAGKLSGDVARDRITQQYLPYYDATVDMADAFVGRVLDAIDRAGLEDRTLVVLVADHGEEFGEHGFFGHGETLNEDAVHVPLIARLPAGAAGPPPGSVSEPLVSLADVAPWILRLCGLSPDPRMQTGAPLGPEHDSPPGRSRLWIELDTRTHSHVQRLSAAREGDWKLDLLLDGAGRGIVKGEPLLYDVTADPKESRDLAPDHPGDAARLAADLERFHEFTEAIRPRDNGPVRDIDSLPPDLQRVLRALGYGNGPPPR